MSHMETYLSRRWRWASLLVLVLLATFMRLGVWQLDRLQQRRAANDALRTALASNLVTLPGAELPADIEPLKDRVVSATGTFDLAEQMVLKVQSWQGQPGIHLLAPLVFADGYTAVLVDRGWLPDAAADQASRSQYDTGGEVTVNGVVALPQTLTRGGATVQPDGAQQEWYRVDVPAIARQLPYELLPVYIIQAPDGDDQELPYRAVPAVDLSEGPHLGYAVQWFLFALIGGVGYVIYVRRSERPTQTDT